MNNLKPCPFCNCTDILSRVESFGIRYISCRECGATINRHSDTDAINAWNRRDDAKLEKCLAFIRLLADCYQDKDTKIHSSYAKHARELLKELGE